MCIIKNRNKQKISGDNYGNIAGENIIEKNYSDNRKYVSIINFFCDDIPQKNNEKYYSVEYKQYMNSFKELDGYLLNLVVENSNNKYDFSGNYLKFSKGILDWIMGISKFPIEGYKLFCKELIQNYKIEETDIILKRWEAFEYYFSSNITKSLDIYYNILENIEKLECQYEIIDDILIDGRNILIEEEQLKNKISFNNPFQEEIEKHTRKLTMSIYDRIKKNCYEKALKDTFITDTKGANTTIYLTSLDYIFNEIQELVFITIFYGSITHLKTCREVIANIMYSYSKIYDEERFYEITLKMLALSGNYKEYQKLCLYLGDSIDFWYSQKFINEIIDLKNETLDYKKINYDNFIYGFYGKYLCDDGYEELEQKIFGYLRNIEKANVNLIHEILKSINTNIFRTSRIKELLEIFEMFIKKKYFRYFHEISKILNNINIDDLEIKSYKKYVKVVYNLSKISTDVNLNVSIAKILNNSKCSIRFKKYKKDSKVKKLMEFDKNMCDDFKFLEEMIDDYEKRYYQKEKNPQIIIEYSTIYRLSIKYFVDSSKNEKIIGLIEERYLPLILKIVESENQTNNFKIEQLKNLLYISSIDDYSYMQDEIINIINRIKFGFGKENQFINTNNYIEANEYEIKLYVILINSLIKEENNLNSIIITFFEKYLDNKISTTSIIECLKTIGNIKKYDECVINQIYCFYIYISEKKCVSDLEKLELLNVFFDTKYEAKAIKILERYSRKCTYGVAKKIINIIQKYDNYKTKSILENLKENDNFNVRLLVKNYKEGDKN